MNVITVQTNGSHHTQGVSRRYSLLLLPNVFLIVLLRFSNSKECV